MLVADISQCPGLVEITGATPNWKREMIEKKNRDKIEEYVVRIRPICVFNSIHCPEMTLNADPAVNRTLKFSLRARASERACVRACVRERERERERSFCFTCSKCCYVCKVCVGA